MNASAETVRNALNNLVPPALRTALFFTVVKSNNVFTINCHGGGDAELTGYWTNEIQPETEVTGSAESGSVTVEQLQDGGVELAVGRIDMAHLGAAVPGSEANLINQYLQRDHAWRFGAAPVANNALIDTSTTVPGNYTTWLESILGAGGQIEQDSWVDKFSQTNEDYLIAIANSSAGQEDAAGVDQDAQGQQTGWVTSYNFGQPVNSVITTAFGSYMGDWNNRSLRNPGSISDHQGTAWPTGTTSQLKPNLIRATLASGGDTLVSCLGFPIGWSSNDTKLMLGYTVGDGFRGTALVNNLFGDPTVRTTILKPALNLHLGYQDFGNPMIPLSWYHSADHNVSGFGGYLVYRADSPDGPFTRLTISPLTGTTYQDTTAEFDHEYTYMVRALTNTTNGQTFDNLSQGIFLSVTNQGSGFYGFESGGGGAMSSSSYGSSMSQSTGGNLFTPPSASVRIFDQMEELFSGTSSDLLDLGRNSLGSSFDPNEQIGWSSAHQLTIDFSFDDSDSHDVLLDFGDALDAGSTQVVELINPETGKVLTNATTEGASGNILRLSLRGHVQVRISGANGAPANVSGISVSSAG
jgi:hypothetical protein